MAKENKSKKLYEFRNRNYTKASPHYAELNTLIKKGNKDALIDFGTEKLLEGPDFDEFMSAVDTRFPEGDKAPRSAKVEEEEEDGDITL